MIYKEECSNLVALSPSSPDSGVMYWDIVAVESCFDVDFFSEVSLNFVFRLPSCEYPDLYL